MNNFLQNKRYVEDSPCAYQCHRRFGKSDQIKLLCHVLYLFIIENIRILLINIQMQNWF